MPSKQDFEITTDPARIEPDEVEAFLRQSYWASSRSRERIERSMRNSLCFAAFDGSVMIGFARVVTDYADFAWLCDVFVHPEHRARGVGLALTNAALEHPELRGLRRWVLATSTAHGLYRKAGYTELRYPEMWMERPGV